MQLVEDSGPQKTGIIDCIENTFDSQAALSLVWHKMCYAHFTDKSKIERRSHTECVNTPTVPGTSNLKSKETQESEENI